MKGSHLCQRYVSIFTNKAFFIDLISIPVLTVKIHMGRLGVGVGVRGQDTNKN